MRQITVDGRPMLSVSVAELCEGDTVGGRPLEIAQVGADVYLRVPGPDGRTLLELSVPEAERARITIDPREGFSAAALADRLAADQAARTD